MKLIPSICVVLMAVLLMAGCGATPRQRFNVATVTYDVTVIGLAVAEKNKPFPPAVWQQITADEAIALNHLADARKWLGDNPTLADVPGAPFPPLDPLNLAVDVLLAQLHNVILVPPSIPPATQP